jgi:hypothetical protein
MEEFVSRSPFLKNPLYISSLIIKAAIIMITSNIHGIVLKHIYFPPFYR